MRTILTAAVGAALVFSAACSSTLPKGTSSSGGASTGGSGSATGDDGSPCTKDSNCNSNNCAAGNALGGLCCHTTCQAGDPHDLCTQPVGCDDGGACVYPPTKSLCGVTCTESDTQLVQNVCNDHICQGGPTKDCTPYTCTNSQICLTSCTGDGGQCAPAYYCNGGQCVPQSNVGACDSDAQCSSGVCGINGNCCSVACPPSANDTTDCNASGCTFDGGACQYPIGHACVAQGITHLCVGDNTILGGECNFTGVCEMDAGDCPSHLACDPKGDSCSGPTCRVAADCATGFYCKGQICIPQQVDGGCSSDDQCLSEVCGTNGTGPNCCAAGCADSGVCGATTCDGKTAACNYPDDTVSCGPGGSCVNLTETGTAPTVCNGAGGCPVPGMAKCTPYVCNSADTGCNTSCAANTDCDTTGNDICDITAGKCCAGFGPGANPIITVDGTKGTDGPCCGLPQAPAAFKSCATITYAMKLIDDAEIKNAKIVATNNGGGGDWAPAGEVYPIVLGWGVELSAPGIAFLDPKAAGAEIFEIKQYSANDTVATAAIDGAAGKNAIVGYNALNTIQTTDSSSILVEKGATLYLANVDVNGNATQKTTAISIQGGGTLTLGSNGLQLVGSVLIGTTVGTKTDGWNGIICAAGSLTQPCTITDATLVNQSSVEIFNQENIDLEADDYASVTLTSMPSIGIAPGQIGFGKCGTKNDGKGGTGYGLLLDGAATVSFKGGTIACIASPGIYLESTPNGTPILTLDSSTVENTELGLYAGAGAATVTGTTFQFNYNGVEVAGSGSVDLDDSVTGNTVICDSSKESANVGAMAPGIGVLNTTSSTIDASNTSWDTKGPDVFSCGSPVTGANCTCAITTCSQGAGKDDMDAVNTSSGTITTTNPTQSATAVSNSCG